MPGTKKLVIVESPAKAKTIAQYLGDGYEVQASVGHIRDLIEPKNLPPELKKGSLGKFSIDVENGFAPYYVVSDAKKKTVADLKRALKDADELYLATDEDREGEAIAWHLLEVLKPKVPVKRMVFHEITKEAIQRRAKELPRARHRPRRRPRDPPHPRPPLRLRGLAGALAQGRARPLGRPRAVRRDPARRRPRARAPRLRRRVVLGPDRPARRRSRRQRRSTPSSPASTASASPRGRDFDDRGQLSGGCRRPRRGRGRVARRRAAPPTPSSTVDERRVEALHPPPRRAVHHLDAAAGGGAQAALLGPPDHERRAGPVRERLHHLYAHRLVDAVAAGDRRGPQPGRQALRRRDGARQAARLRQQVEERAGGARGDPPVRRDVQDAGRAVERAARQRLQALRPDLEAHRRLADGRRPRVHRVGDHRGRDRRMPARAEFTASGTVITFRGFLSAYEEGHDEERNAGDADRRERCRR